MSRLPCWMWVLLCFCLACTRNEPKREQLSVYAASSLTEAFQALEHRFEQQQPEVDVTLTFSGSQVARVQLERGAPGDVFASANEEHLRALATAGIAADLSEFAQSELVVIVPQDNPANIEEFADLPRASRLVLGASNVPIGIYTQSLLERAGQHLGFEFVEQVRARVVSEESNVRLVRAKVELGEADAAIVYSTDAHHSKALRIVSIPTTLNVSSGYFIAPLRKCSRPALAEAFIRFVLSPEGQDVLKRHGFTKGAS